MSSPPIFHQPSTTHTHTVVFLHGRGDNAEIFMQSLNYSRDSQNRTLADAFPSFRWVFPQAKLGKSVAFGDKVSQWFDIWNVSNFADREELQAEGLRDSVVEIREILAAEAQLLGDKWSRIILAGISQGAATGVHTLLNLRLPPGQSGLGAFVGFSCRMPFPGRSLADTRAILRLGHVAEGCVLLEHTPILLEHCVDDPLVLIANGRVLRDTLRRFGAQVEWKEYQEGGHWFNSPTGMDDAVRFLNFYLSE
ncbi:Phospholipase/Carboxylesterase family protein [Colletotrichum godetiae]|uniref:Phospholipase/Carboxylesterase family protein n=1 Tax=Colletotrichum godetiae TaxID=1209918 RepID=A0AAJ0ETQ7_9PEZI|nr:Phospholipase/Carboxylesterase family protein [Colletotrichum godetiae]KAK1676461.1 Phospholipase/Carboxylesterase family protein [Colletotrichum godetiae]